MSFFGEMKIANHAMRTGEEESQLLARAIFAYVLWFYFDHGLKGEDAQGSWYGELYLETSNPDEHTVEQVHEETFVLVLIRRDNNAEDRIADCIFMPAKFLNPTAMARAFGHADLIERRTFVPRFVFKDSKDAVELYSEFFAIANDFFTDVEDPELRHFREILEDILTPEAMDEVMQVVMKHYVNFSMGRGEMSNDSVVLDFSEARLGALDELKTKLGIETWKEFFNHAIGLLEWAVMQRELGRVIMVGEHENKNYREVSMLLLNRIQPRAQ